MTGSLLNSLINGLLRRSNLTFSSPIIKEMDIWGKNICSEKYNYIYERLCKNEVLQIAIDIYNEMYLTKFNLESGIRRLFDHALEGNNGISIDLSDFPIIGKPFDQNKIPPRFISSKQFQADIFLLLSEIPPDITSIVGISRSGVSVASLLAMYLQLPLFILRPGKDIIDAGNGWRLNSVKNGRVLVVDDTVMSGKSLLTAKPIVDKFFKDVIYGAVYVNPLSNFLPDIWAVDLSWPHLLEWNIFNSILSTSVCTDFDGILCWDCDVIDDDDGDRYFKFLSTAKSLYVPRRVPIPLIVTARLEKYRGLTESWLRKYDIKYNELIMYPDIKKRR